MTQLPPPLELFCIQLFKDVESDSDLHQQFDEEKAELKRICDRLGSLDKSFQRSFAAKWVELFKKHFPGNQDESRVYGMCNVAASLIKVCELYAFDEPYCLTAEITERASHLIGFYTSNSCRHLISAAALSMSYDVLLKLKHAHVCCKQQEDKEVSVADVAPPDHSALSVQEIEKLLTCAEKIVKGEEQECVPSKRQIQLAIDKAKELPDHLQKPFQLWTVSEEASFTLQLKQQDWIHQQALVGVIAWLISQKMHNGHNRLPTRVLSYLLASRCPCVSCGIARGCDVQEFTEYTVLLQNQIHNGQLQVLKVTDFHVRCVTPVDVMHQMAKMYCQFKCKKPQEKCECREAWCKAEKNFVEVLYNLDKETSFDGDIWLFMWQIMMDSQHTYKRRKMCSQFDTSKRIALLQKDMDG